MEKGFKGAGELNNEVALAEADMLRFARTDKNYLGRDKTLNTDGAWICAYLEIEPDSVADGHGGEAAMLDGKVVGSTASAAFGPTVGTILAFAYIKPQAAERGTALQVIVRGKPRNARVLHEPAYDPQTLLPRADTIVEPTQ
ncbi:glycine cleavage T C-terminal barrel domain-containing protein [Tateyamaria omphalii]|uniref:glycine cleavage T C-terminal barrel domain-containing protein n=1 Tax=Tateyamaria omphalii TaxID=299262 RepID=UPI0028F6F32A|nr:glycine cleavage T C-terminal barrel domain-containing protein [Tateyamaria omphalii]